MSDIVRVVAVPDADGVGLVMVAEQGPEGAQGATGLTGADSTVPGPTGAQGVQGEQGTQGIGRATLNPIVPLAIPTYDANPSITHPSVVYVPAGFGGYTRWMAFTPYPDGARENPSIVASNDGVTWEVPSGLTNPLTTNAEAIASGYALWSDTHLMHHDGSLYLYFRGTGSDVEGIFLMTSVNGVTWTARQEVFTSATNRAVLSPAVVHDGSQFVMYSVNDEEADSTLKVKRRTSATAGGFVLAGETTVTMPASTDYRPWHLDVQYENGRYHMLVQTHYSLNNARLIYLRSGNGTAFTGRTSGRAVPILGYGFDASGHYRSALVPVPGNPVSFDVYVATYQPGAIPAWRVAYLRGLALAEELPRASVYSAGMARDYNRIFIPAQQFVVQAGASAFISGTWSRYSTLNLPKDVRSRILTNIGPIPRDWQGVDAYVVGWFGGGATVAPEAIDMRVSWKHHNAETGKNNSGWGVTVTMPLTLAAGVTGDLKKFLCGRTLAAFSDHDDEDWDFAWLQVERLGDTAGDTGTRDFYLHGVILEAYEAPFVRHVSAT